MRAALALAFALIFAAPVARAQPDLREQARRHFAQGVALFDSGNHEAALTEFEEAQRLRPHPRILLNIAATLEALQRYVDAITTLERFEQDPQTTPAERRSAETHLRGLRALLARLEIVVQPAGAEVLVDGLVVGVSPLAEPVTIASGNVHVLARRAGFRTVERDVRVAAGGVAREELTLEPLAARLHLESNAPGARARVSEGPPRPLPRDLVLAPGAHRVRTEAPGYLTATTEIVLAPEEDRTLTVVLERPPATLRLDVRPASAHVRVDGEVRAGAGRSVLRAAGGPHRLRVEGEGLVPWEDEVQLHHGGTHRLRARLGRDRLWVRPAWFWAGLVATTGLAAAATVVGVRVLMLGRDPSSHTSDEWIDILEERRSLSGVVDALWLGAVAAALGTGALYLLSRGEPPDPQVDWR